MPKLLVTSGRQARRAFNRAGWRFERQRGSHMIMAHDQITYNLAVPDHKELDRGLLRGLIRDSDLSVDEFLELLSK